MGNNNLMTIYMEQLNIIFPKSTIRNWRLPVMEAITVMPKKC